MTMEIVLDLGREALTTALLLAGPLLGVALVTGLIVGMIQAVTSIQEQTLAFVPKLFAIGMTFLLLLTWMISLMVRYTTELFERLPTFTG